MSEKYSLTASGTEPAGLVKMCKTSSEEPEKVTGDDGGEGEEVECIHQVPGISLTLQYLQR